MSSNAIKLLNPLMNPSGYLTTVDQIYDPYKGKTQQELNNEIGRNIDSINNYYAVYNSSIFEGTDIYNEMNWVLIPNKDGIEMPSMDPINRYLWNYEIIVYTDGEAQKSEPTVIGVYGQGRGISSIKYWYLINNDKDNRPSVDDEEWNEYSEATTDEAKYLWRKTETFYTDDNVNPEITIELMGVHGTPGIDGSNREYVYILLSDIETDESGNIIPSRPAAPTAVNNTSNDSLSDESKKLGWSDEPSDVTKDKPYLWISDRKKPQGASTWQEYSEPKLWAIYGKSIISIISKYAINNDSANPPSLDEKENGESVWKDKSPAVTTEKPFLWKYTQTILSGNDEREEFELIGSKGEKGNDGLDVEYIYIRTETWDGTENDKPILPIPLEDNNGNTNTNVNDFIPKGWSDEPEGVSKDVPYQWMRMRKKDSQNNVWGDFSEAKLWAVYGKSVLNIEKLYQISNDPDNHPDETDDDNDTNINNWLKVSPAVTDAKPYLWEKTITTMTGGGENITYALIGVKGKPGTDGADIEYIYTKTKTWDGTDEGKPSIPSTGTVPEIGEDGKLTGNRIEGSSIDNDFVPTGWTDEPEDASSDYIYIWCSMRKKNVGSSTWANFSTPKVWAKYGEDGNSLLSSESEYARSSSSDIIPGTVDEEGKDISGWDSSTGWQSSSPIVTEEYPFLWRKTIMTYSKPFESETETSKIIYEMIGVKGNKGVDGSDVEYAYLLAKSIETNEDGVIIKPTTPIGSVEGNNTKEQWSDDPFDVDEIYKYEWISYRKFNGTTWGEWQEPKLWAKFGSDGVTPISIDNKYMISSTYEDNPDSTKDVPTNYLKDDVVQWQSSSPATNNTYKYLWKKTITTYSKDIEIDGVMSENKEVITYDMVGTHGDPGVDGSTVDYIYALTKNNVKPKGYDKITAPLNQSKESDGETWYDEPQDITDKMQYLWISSAEKESGSSDWSSYSTPTLWAKFGVDGNSIISVEVSYLKSASSTLNDDIANSNEATPLPNEAESDVWYTSSPELDSDNKYLWKRTKLTYNRVLTGTTNGNIDYKYEMIGSLGDPGIDGAGSEWAYYLATDDNNFPTSGPTGEVNSNPTEKNPNIWTDDPQGVDKTYRYEFVSKRSKSAGGEFGAWSKPAIYSRYSIDGVSIVESSAYFTTSDSSTTPNIDKSLNDEGETYYKNYEGYINYLKGLGWNESISNAIDKYIFEVQLVKYSDLTYDIWGPSLKSSPGKQGEKGVGIKTITEYYGVSASSQTTPTVWETNPSEAKMSINNRYLWNYEVVTYTDGSANETTPIIIGTYSVGIKSIKKYYRICNSDTITPDDDPETSGIETIDDSSTGLPSGPWDMYENLKYLPVDDWAETSPTVTDEYPYLWEKTVTVLDDDGGETITYTCVGSKGVDSLTEEYIYCGSNTLYELEKDLERLKPKYPTDLTENWEARSTNDYIPSGWSDDMPILNESKKYAYMSKRSKLPRMLMKHDGTLEEIPITSSFKPMKALWGEYSTPKLYAQYTVDGRGIERIEEWYKVSSVKVTENNIPEYKDNVDDYVEQNGWVYNSAPEVNSVSQYLYNCERIKYTNGDENITNPSLIGNYSKDPVQLICDKPIISHPIDPDTEETLTERTYTVYVRLVRGGEFLDISNYTLTASVVAESESYDEDLDSDVTDYATSSSSSEEPTDDTTVLDQM